jgi:hypothetical protein
VAQELETATVRAWLRSPAAASYLAAWRTVAPDWTETAGELASSSGLTLPAVLRETRAAAEELQPAHLGAPSVPGGLF